MKPEAHVPVVEYAHDHPVLQNPGETRTLDHLPQLDGLRAVAVSMVLWSHFVPAANNFRGLPPWGAVGVGLFFTLSGFLITRILLNCRTKIDDGRMGFWATCKQFYVRRFLRIFPLYYGVLAVFFAFDLSGFRSRAIYSILYLTNYRFSYAQPAWLERALGDAVRAVTHWKMKYKWQPVGGAAEGHLWSLSVEEQFYIVWPFLILLCPRRLLMPLILATIAVGPVWRTYTYEIGLQKHEWMTPGCLDLLAMGGLLALLSLPKFGWSRWRDGFVQLCGLIGVPMAVAYMAQRWYPTVMAKGRLVGVSFDRLDYGGFVYPFTALAGVWLIGTAARGFRGPIGWFLTCPPVVYLGRISYGVYVLHLFVPHLLENWYPHVFSKSQRTLTHTLLFTAIAVALASLSWFFYEAPINKLKRYFEYDRTASANAPTPAVAA